MGSDSNYVGLGFRGLGFRGLGFSLLETDTAVTTRLPKKKPRASLETFGAWLLGYSATQGSLLNRIGHIGSYKRCTKTLHGCTSAA